MLLKLNISSYLKLTDEIDCDYLMRPMNKYYFIFIDYFSKKHEHELDLHRPRFLIMSS